MQVDVPPELSVWEAQNALRSAVSEKRAAIQRGIDNRKHYEASLRRQGYDEEYIRAH